MAKANKWRIHLRPLVHLHPDRSGDGATYIADKVFLNDRMIRATAVSLIMLPDAPVSLQVMVMPRDLEIVTED